MPIDVIVFDLLQEMFNSEKKGLTLYGLNQDSFQQIEIPQHTLSSMHVTEFFSTDSKKWALARSVNT